MPRPYVASDSPEKFTDQIDRLNDRVYSRTLAAAVRPLGRAIADPPADVQDENEAILGMVKATVECFGGDPELAIHYLMMVVDQLLRDRVHHERFEQGSPST